MSEQQLARARKVQRYVVAAAAEHGVDPNLLNGVIWNESKFNPKARNRSGARGLMQLMPKTGKAMARALGRRFRPYDPEFSVHAGAKLLSILLGKFEDDEELALFGYARGGGRVRRYKREGGDIPEGVQRFIARVRRAQQTFVSLGFPEPTGDS
ncbi:MAG: lytic transglycosylase domain-containing protein [Nannocystaceae bacterium]|nr:lytic transglycosylase domain-containing protein [Nannocystaceae bacterium]